MGEDDISSPNPKPRANLSDAAISEVKGWLMILSQRPLLAVIIGVVVILGLWQLKAYWDKGGVKAETSGEAVSVKGNNNSGIGGEKNRTQSGNGNTYVEQKLLSAPSTTDSDTKKKYIRRELTDSETVDRQQILAGRILNALFEEPSRNPFYEFILWKQGKKALRSSLTSPTNPTQRVHGYIALRKAEPFTALKSPLQDASDSAQADDCEQLLSDVAGELDDLLDVSVKPSSGVETASLVDAATFLVVTAHHLEKETDTRLPGRLRNLLYGIGRKALEFKPDINFSKVVENFLAEVQPEAVWRNSLVWNPESRELMVTSIKAEAMRLLPGDFDGDGRGDLVQISDAFGNQTSCIYTYDMVGNRVDNTALSYTYDAAGRIIEIKNEAGAAFSCSYDALGNLLSSSVSQSSLAVASASSPFRMLSPTVQSKCEVDEAGQERARYELAFLVAGSDYRVDALRYTQNDILKLRAAIEFGGGSTVTPPAHLLSKDAFLSWISEVRDAAAVAHPLFFYSGHSYKDAEGVAWLVISKSIAISLPELRAAFAGKVDIVLDSCSDEFASSGPAKTIRVLTTFDGMNWFTRPEGPAFESRTLKGGIVTEALVQSISKRKSVEFFGIKFSCESKGGGLCVPSF